MKKGSLARRGAAGFIMLAAIVLFSASLNGQTPELRWLVRFQESPCYDISRGVAADASGVYVIEQSCICVSGEHYLECAGNSFIAKFDPFGNELWRKPIAVNDNCQAWGIALYGSNIYVCGRTRTILTDWPWIRWKTFVAKFDTNGNQIGAVQFGIEQDQNNGGIAVDSTGVYVVDGGYGNLPGSHREDFNVFLFKLDHNLNLAWARELGTDGYDNAWGVATDATGVYVTGDTRGNFYDPDAVPFRGTPNGGIEDWDVFVVKFGSDGNEIWRTQFGTAFVEGRTRISVVASSLYLAGFTAGAFPGQTNLGGEEAFVAKLSTDNGSLLKISQFGPPGTSDAKGIVANASGLFVTGNVGGQFPSQTDVFGQDCYVAAFDADLNMKWVKQFGTYAPDEGWGIALSPAGIYASGCVEAIWDDQLHANDFKGFVALLAPPYLSVDIDIKPGSYPNTINLKSKGNVPVAIFGKAGFDATNVNPLTVTLTGAPVILQNNGRPMASFEDINGDGFMDLVLHFDTTTLRLTQNDTQAVLDGRTYDGRAIKGVDSVRIIK